MSILDYNEIRERKVIIYNDEPCVVVSSHVARTQMRKPTNQTKLKSLVSGKVFQAIFQASDRAEEAEIEKRPAKFLYAQPQKNEWWFVNPEDAKDRYSLSINEVGETAKWLKADMEVTIKVFSRDDDSEVIIGVDTPIKIEMTVKEAPPNAKGDTATGGRKIVKLENGTELSGVPMFIEAGDVIIINTETGEYVELVEKNN